MAATRPIRAVPQVWAAPRNRKMVDQFVVHVFDYAVDHLRFRGAGVGVVVEREAVVDERNVAVDFAGPVVEIGPQTEKLRLEAVVLLVLDLAAEIVEVVEHEVDTSEALVDTGVEMHYAAVRRGDGGLGVVRPFREHRAHGADVGELVHPPVGKRLVLLDVIGEALVGGEHARPALRRSWPGRFGGGPVSGILSSEQPAVNRAVARAKNAMYFFMTVMRLEFDFHTERIGAYERVVVADASRGRSLRTALIGGFPGRSRRSSCLW